SDPDFKDINRLMDQLEKMQEWNENTDDGFGIEDLEKRPGIRQDRAVTMLRILMAKLSNETRIRAGYTFSEIVAKCTFAGRDCSLTDFESFLHPDYGVCYTFVVDHEMTRPGEEQGLRMLMVTNAHSPADGSLDHLPTTDSNAFWAVIHSE
ncbi:hypothetical protein PENTCL1PPCAC_7747, partial [Pristionchus entomophagus]